MTHRQAAGAPPAAGGLWPEPTERVGRRWIALIALANLGLYLAYLGPIAVLLPNQVQAIAGQNPSVMSDTATPAHYQQLVQTNQNLLAQAVTSIQLTNISWGPISINGSTATATSYETWVTTFSDSTTMQSTDTNVYTLVQQNGAWIISG